MTRLRKKDERHWHVELFDGRATATVYVEDGYGRPVSEVRWVNGPVHTREEAIAAVREDVNVSSLAARVVAAYEGGGEVQR